MLEIIPAIIADDIKGIKEKLSLIEGLVSWAQIDVIDGVFAPSITWQTPSELTQLETAINIEVHLMIAKPEETIDSWLASPVKRIVLHYESTTPDKIKELIKKINTSKKEVGIALKLETPVSVLDSLIHNSLFVIHVVQLMSIAEIGYYGHGFDEKVLEKISSLHVRYPDVIIEIDGGVTQNNAPLALQKGACNLVAGSSIFKSKDITKTIQQFNKILKS